MERACSLPVYQQYLVIFEADNRLRQLLVVDFSNKFCNLIIEEEEILFCQMDNT